MERRDKLSIKKNYSGKEVIFFFLLILFIISIPGYVSGLI